MSQQSVESSKKRARQVNFFPAELSVIADEVKLRSNVLFGAFSSTITNQSKMKEWDAIASKWNANSSVLRNGQQIRKKWNDYRSKKKAIDSRKETRKTGGGCPPESLSDVEHKVVVMIPSCQIEGIAGGVDTEQVPDEEIQTSCVASLKLEPVAETAILTATLPASTATSTSSLLDASTSATPNPGITASTSATPNPGITASTSATPNPVITEEKLTSRPTKSRKPYARGKNVAAPPSHVSSILEIEETKRDTLQAILAIQREMLSLRREEVALNRERLDLEKAKWEAQNTQNILSLSPIIKF